MTLPSFGSTAIAKRTPLAFVSSLPGPIDTQRSTAGVVVSALRASSLFDSFASATTRSTSALTTAMTKLVVGTTLRETKTLSPAARPFVVTNSGAAPLNDTRVRNDCDTFWVPLFLMRKLAVATTGEDFDV